MAVPGLRIPIGLGEEESLYALNMPVSLIPPPRRDVGRSEDDRDEELLL